MSIELSSTATAPIAFVELAVFLGATMPVVRATRASALPTSRPRDLEDGGVAFRARSDTLILPGATRLLRVDKEALPLRDLSAVHAVVIDCRSARSVAEATIEVPPPPPSEASWPIAAGVGLVALACLYLGGRVLRGD